MDDCHRLNRLLRTAATILLALVPWSAAADLEPAVQADLYLVQTEAYLEDEDYAAAKDAMSKIVALSEEHDFALPDEFHFKYAQVLDMAGAHAESVASVTRYLELTGRTGQHYREALGLMHKAMQGAATADDAAFESARSDGTVQAYEEYLTSYPDGRHATEARRMQAVAQREQEERADDTAFRKAQSAGTAAAYEGYLESYPSGRHAEEARTSLDNARAVQAWPAEAERLRHVGPGRQFRDCRHCPLMVEIPLGWYVMGSPESEEGRRDDEGPQHRVTIGEPFAAGVYEVTFVEWDACVSDGGCGRYRPDDRGWGRGDRPVIYVSWEDAQSYVRWLSRETGQEYRLLSESEWEYVARAGTTTPFHTGGTISTDQANYDGNYTYSAGRKGRYRGQTVPVGSFAANGFGLYDVHGNVWEWTQDCWNGSYRGAPTDRRAWERGDCSRRVERGGSWFSIPGFLRSADRSWTGSGYRFDYVGFRVARTLTP